MWIECRSATGSTAARRPCATAPAADHHPAAGRAATGSFADAVRFVNRITSPQSKVARRMPWLSRYGPRAIASGPLDGTRPVVGAEGRRRQARGVVQVAVGIGRPGVADGHRLRHIRTGHDHRVAADLGVGLDPLLVGPRNRKTFHLVPLGRQTAVAMLKRDDDLAGPRSAGHRESARRRAPADRRPWPGPRGPTAGRRPVCSWDGCCRPRPRRW